MQALYDKVPEAQALAPQARGLLVFPKVLKGGFIFDQEGLMAGLGLQGSKFTRIER
jgi:lipid-binding SYLF domain-containing protein